MERWYENKELLLAAVEKYGSVDAAARAIGGAHVSTIQKAYQRHNLPKRKPGPTPKGAPNQDALRELAEKLWAN